MRYYEGKGNWLSYKNPIANGNVFNISYKLSCKYLIQDSALPNRQICYILANMISCAITTVISYLTGVQNIYTRVSAPRIGTSFGIAPTSS